MTKISQYSTDVNITGNDKWIGSDAQNYLITKNFTPNNLAEYFNGNNVIDIGTSVRYMYQTLNPGEAREQGTISFETERGPQVNFSDITTFLIAKNTLKGNTVTDYLDFLVDSKVLLSKANNINTFGYYKITEIDRWIPNPNFFVVTVDFLNGNGFIYEDLDYLISLVDKAQDSVTPTLQSVVNAGNGISNFGGIGVASIQSTNFTNNRTLYLNDNLYPTIRLVDNGNASHNLTIDLDTISLNGTPYNWSTIVNPPASPLSALPFTTDHLSITNNQYVIGDLVWYLGNVYRCIASNDSIIPTSSLYWTNLGAGYPLVQQPVDWSSTSGNNQILNKPTIPSVSGTVNYIPRFTPNGVSLGNSIIKQIGAGGLDAISINYSGRNALDGNTSLSLQRGQTQIDFALGNPGYDQPNLIISDNQIDGFQILSKGILSLRAGLSYTEGLRVLSTGKLQFTQTPDTGITSDKLLVRDTSGNVKQIDYPTATTPTLQQVLDNNHDLVNGNNFQGTSAGLNNTGSNVNAFGYVAGRANTKDSLNAFGYFAGDGNTGTYVNVFGRNAGIGNTGDNLNAFGISAASSNTGKNVNAFGSGAGLNNTFKDVNLFGEGAIADSKGQTVFSFLNDAGTQIYNGRLSFAQITANRKWELPDESGTIALTSDVGVTSVGLTMPPAFVVTNSPITESGDIAVTGAGLVSQYIRGDGSLANFPNSTGGGSSVNYYLNGSVSQGTFGGTTYYQMSKTPILGAGTNFTRTNGQGNGYIASFITDAGDPNQLNIPGGNWNVEFYFQSSSTGGSPQFYAELYKVSETNTFTLVASGSSNPEGITNGTSIDQYYTSIPVPQTSLLITDRLAIRIYVITSGRTITLHTENGNICEVLTTFTTGITALNGLTQQVQYFDEGTAGTDFNISSVTDTHTFNLPTASATNRGALNSTDWTTFNNKQNASTRRNANNSLNNNINYCGVALGTGVSESATVWTIKRLTIAASGSITIATATNVAWTNRQSATYT